MVMEGKVELPESKSIIIKFVNAVFRTLEAPGDWIRENVVKPNQEHYPYYHQQYRRVPTIDQCYDDDVICKHEANMQFLRDKRVESYIISILRSRFEDCVVYEGADAVFKCKPLQKAYREAETNWFIKYGDLGAIGKAEDCYMKQKHRMVWERRNGPVGSKREGENPSFFRHYDDE